MTTSIKKFPCLSVYLAAKGVTGATPQNEVDLLKKQYRKEYQRLYGKQRRKEKKRLEPTLTKAEYQRFKKAAKRHKEKSPSAFLLKCGLAYLDQHYIPHNEDLIRQYAIQIQRIGNNVNQIVHALHYQKDYTNKAAYQQLKNQIDKLQKAVQKHLMTSLPIGEELVRLFTEQPHTVQYFEEFLEEWKAKNS